MGMFEKRRFHSFLIFVQEFNLENAATWKDVDPHRTTADELLKKYSLENPTTSERKNVNLCLKM